LSAFLGIPMPVSDTETLSSTGEQQLRARA
jgi:hypothetical protein